MVEKKQLILIADYLPKVIRNRSYDFSNFLNTSLKDIKLIYTSLLPGPELQLTRIAYEKDIPYIAVIPYKKYAYNWPKLYRKEYNFYLKRAIKIFYIDRELGYISLKTSPDIYGKEKIAYQIKWLFSKIQTSNLDTKLITYCMGLHTYKMREITKLISYLSNEDIKKCIFIQKTFLYQYLQDLDEVTLDTCPF